MSAQPPQELKERLPHEPILWMRNYLRHPEDPSRPYDFYDGSGEKFLYYLVDEDGPLRPENWGDINIFLFARGCLKTATCTAIGAWGVDAYPTVEIAATAPVDDQRYEVVERFKDKVEEAGLDELRDRDKLSHQKFRHTVKDPKTGEEHTSYSHLKSRSAWGEGDKLRGLHAHIGIIDEAQDVDEGTFSAFATEAVDREVPSVDYFPSIFVIGTPKMANTFYHKLWRMAEQRTWDADANEWVLQAEGEDFLPEELREAKQRLEEEGREEEAAEIQGFTVKGWHVDQPNSPLHDPARIAFKKETYSKKKYENEVLANFYSPENDLIVNDDVWESMDEDSSFVTSRKSDDSIVGLGVDWGGGEGEGAASTVITVGEMNTETEHTEIRNISILDSSMGFRDEVEQVHEMMVNYHVDVAVVDEGFGDSERQTLQDEYEHDNLYGCWYGHVKKKEDVVWNRFKNKKRFFTANKTYMVRKFAEDFKDLKFMIPAKDLDFGTKRDKGTRIIDELTAPYTDRTETTDGKKKLKVISDRRDDIFDSFTYLWIALNKIGNMRRTTKVGHHDRYGYT